LEKEESNMNRVFRAALLLLSFVALPHALAQSGAPIRIGMTLSLTGPVAAPGAIQKVATEVYVEDLNKRGGLLGRKVELILRDDQSRPDLARTLYEQLVTVDKVDLIMGPYGTANILSAMSVAQRYNKILLHNSFGTPRQAKYDMQFSTSGGAFDIEEVWPNLVFNAVASTPKPPKTIAIVTSKFPSLHFISVGAREVAKKRGLSEVTYLEYEFGNRDFGPIASRLKDAKPDFIWFGAGGIDGVLLLDAMKKIDYLPPMHFYMFPAPGPMVKTPEAKNALAFTTFEEHPPFTNNARAAQFIEAYHQKGKAAGLPDSSVDLLASICYSMWQTLEAAVNATRSIEDKTLAAWLRKNQVESIMGTLRWDGPQNFIEGKDLYKIKQLQGGKWVVVWPAEFAAPGAKLIGP
jgi:ABC-type branched-subunit amino acid transport system substrate-binding protein